MSGGIVAMAPHTIAANVGAMCHCKAKAGLRCSPAGPSHILITAQIESRFITEDDLVPFHCRPIPLCAISLQTEASVGGWVSCAAHVRGACDTRCPSARRVAMFQEDTESLSEGVACVWKAANEAVGSTRACRMM
ncbi:hypothetical protein TNCV_2217561 [Trichonephila clavipes]|nr:hypothetical protein TNCV_2217561 [Trichonephila clavipes]